MARRRTHLDAQDGDVMPLELLAPGARNARRAWFHDRQLYAWPDQWAALQEVRRVHGLNSSGRDPNAPDPRELLYAPDNYTTKEN